MDAPIYLAPADRDFIPHKYIIYLHSQVCDSCGTTNRWSDVYGETHLAARSGAGKYVTNRRPINRMTQIQYNLPITTINYATHTPFCHNCFRAGMLTHLPHPPAPRDTRSELVAMPIVQKAPKYTRWQDKHGNWHTEEVDPQDQPKIKTPKAAASKFTVDDL